MKHGWSTSPARREVKNRDRVQHSGITPCAAIPPRLDAVSNAVAIAFVAIESIECAHRSRRANLQRSAMTVHGLPALYRLDTAHHKA